MAEYNKASLRACAACGLQEEGRLRDYIYIDFAYHDAISLAVLRHERRDVPTESMADVCGTAYGRPRWMCVSASGTREGRARDGRSDVGQVVLTAPP